MDQSSFKGFYKLSLEEKMNKINDFSRQEGKPAELKLETAEQMTENVIGKFSLPLSVAVNFSINNRKYLIPMAIEEPSVVAAASNGAKQVGNVISENKEKLLIGQIIVEDLPNIRESLAKLYNHKEELLEIACQHSINMVNRGGGPRDLKFEQKQNVIAQYISCYLSFDPCEAMGANATNTVLEALAPFIEEISGGRVLMSILSNYSETAVTTARVSIDIDSLHSDKKTSQEIANRIQKASDYAKIDPYRAVTHNKGIMNGIDGLLMATGNDLRAVSAAVHAYAARFGHYQPLSTWEIHGEKLEGVMTIPLPIATVGGAISVHPTCQWALDVLGRPTARQLSEIAAAVGLVQNFAAIKALVTDGIQKGHMSMQARNLAMQVGARPDEVSELIVKLKQAKPMNSTAAIQLLEELRNEK